MKQHTSLTAALLLLPLLIPSETDAVLICTQKCTRVCTENCPTPKA
jgi:hypothetical protein